ncbi:5-(carboxyamino)imidazole ribonucleotide synthase [Weissella uvarum]|uniref:ATP-grasp domain-containing protein n=1 Tax=Weissella uvarum TaxID=1479233 RepID=UPI0019611454|nr:ATP-grasp domain-containing protein [Weissella uvarum]MBM7617834.1 5-(carboxyamino)imidazole ribonucleotide synthase [Weissella uvarum]MCM0595787.1 ATP-grasp domain-containing protein [Weissella uvarum]
MSGNILPGATIGILGDDIMSNYVAQVAHRQGYTVAAYSDFAEAPVMKEADYRFVGREELVNFMGLSDLITYASSWVPSDVINTLELAQANVPQGYDLISFTDDHALSKAFAEEQAFNITPYEIGTSLDDVASAARNLGYPVIVKPIARHHHENHAVVLKGAYDLGKVAPLIDGAPVIIESWLEHVQEYSMTAVRDQNGEFVYYPLRQRITDKNKLHSAWTVGDIENSVRQEMREITTKIGNSLNYVGAYAVHFFYADSGTLYLCDVTAGTERVDLMYNISCNCSVEAQHMRALTGQKLMPIKVLQESAYLPLVEADLDKLALHWGIQENWTINLYPTIPYSQQRGHVVVTGDNTTEMLNQIQVANIWDINNNQA